MYGIDEISPDKFFSPGTAMLTSLLLLTSVLHGNALPTTFGKGHMVSWIKSSELDDTSGIAASRLHMGVLYTLNDHSSSKRENRVFAVEAKTGTLVATIQLDGVTNGDWEDIAVGPCGKDLKESCVFISDTGDASGSHPRNHIYRFREPTQLREEVISISGHDELRFRWNEPESECLMVDPLGDAYIISKAGHGRGLIGRLPVHAWGGDEINVTVTARLNIYTAHHDPRGCDISPDGKGMLVKATDNIYYWEVTKREYVNAVLTPPETTPYIHEPFGQSIAWAADNSGYFTLSEGRHETLYFYNKN